MERKGSEKMLNKNEFMAAVARKGITNGELARRLGISKNTLSSKLNGKTYFDTKQIEDICKELEIIEDNEKIKIFLYDPSRNRDERC